MPEPLPITIDKGLGINTADGLFSLPLGMTDDCLNVDGDGTIVCAKRYGAQRETATAMGGGLHDLAFVSPTVGPSAFHLWCLYTSGGSAIVNAARYTPGGTAFADVGPAGPGDTAGVGHLVPAFSDKVLVSGPLSFGVNGRYLTVDVGDTPSWGTYVGPGTARNDLMFYHRLAVFVARHNTATQSSRIFFSALDNPLSYPAANKVDVQNRGRYPNVDGLSGAGDLLYAGSLGQPPSVWVIAGASPETYRLERTNASFGFSGTRTCDVLGNTLLGFATGLHTNETAHPQDLFMMSGLEGKLFGNRVRSLVTDTASWAYRDAKTKAWRTRGAVLFMPRRAAATTARDVLYYHAPSDAFWRWTLPSSISPNCFEFEMGTMWIGGNDGRVYKFDTSFSQDQSATFSSYWTTGALMDPHGFQTKVQRVIVYGKQTSGGATTMDVSRNGAAYAGSHTFTMTSTLAAYDLPVDDVGDAYYNRLRFTFPTDGVGCQIHKIVVYLKRVGRVGANA